jgi:hypothetical protein
MLVVVVALLVLLLSYSLADSDTVPLTQVEYTALSNLLNAIGCVGIARPECFLHRAAMACPATGVVYSCAEGSVSAVQASSMGLSVAQLVLPTDVGRLSRLTALDLGNNSISGTIPSALGSLSALVSLRLSTNKLSGSIPILALPNLTALILTTNNLSGSLAPSLFSQLTRLRQFHIANNDLSGVVPLGVVAASALTSLQVHNNRFAQPFVTILTALSTLTALREFIGSRNSFPGELTSVIGKLSNLRRLSLTACDLDGTVPPAIQDLRLLTQLHLDSNAFVGNMPSLTQLAALTLLRLHTNAFVGEFEGNATSLSDCLIKMADDNNCWSACRPPICCSGVAVCNANTSQTMTTTITTTPTPTPPSGFGTTTTTTTRTTVTTGQPPRRTPPPLPPLPPPPSPRPLPHPPRPLQARHDPRRQWSRGRHSSLRQQCSRLERQRQSHTKQSMRRRPVMARCCQAATVRSKRQRRSRRRRGQRRQPRRRRRRPPLCNCPI